MMGRLICWIVRQRGGKHRWVNGRCARCDRKQAVRVAKAAT